MMNIKKKNLTLFSLSRAMVLEFHIVHSHYSLHNKLQLQSFFPAGRKR